MYVCLCEGVTSQTVSDVVAVGASTSKEVAAACGAGVDCGRCRRTLRAIIEAVRAAAAHRFLSDQLPRLAVKSASAAALA